MRKTLTTLAVGSLVAGSVFISPAAFASDSTATATVEGGSLTASSTDAALGTIAFSHSDVASPGEVTVSVDDSTGTGDGWTVTQQVGDFAYTGDNGGVPIGAANFSVASVGQVTHVEGIDGAETVTTGTGGTLDQARTVLSAAADNGQGSYTAPVNVELQVPAGSRAGTYTATMTTTAAPAIAPAE